MGPADASTRTDSSGAYELAVPEGIQYDVYAAPTVPYPESAIKKAVAAKVNARTEGVDFVFAPGIPVTGRVVAEENIPLKNMEVRARFPNAYPPAATVAEDGSFELRVAKAKDGLFLKARSDTLDSAVVGPLSVPPEGITGVTLTLTRPRNCAVSGTLLDPAGRPAQGVRVFVEEADEPRILAVGQDITKPNGAFSVTPLVPGKYYVSVSASTAIPQADRALTEIELHPGQTLGNLRVALNPDKGGGAIAGSVVDETGKPIPSVAVYAHGAVHRDALTNASGRFFISGLSGGTYTLTAYVGGETNKESASDTIVNVPVNTDNMVLVLPKISALKVAGRAYDATTGMPIQEFDVFASYGSEPPYGAFMPGNRPEHVLNDEGAFSLPFTPCTTVVTVLAKGYQLSTQLLDSAPHSAERLNFALVKAKQCGGRVIDPSGNPVAGATIRLGTANTVFPVDLTHTDSDGQFSIDLLLDAPMPLEIAHPDYAPLKVTSEPDMLVVLDSGGTIAGTLTRGGVGLDAVDITVWSRKSAVPFHQYTDSNGHFRFAHLPEGTATVWAPLEDGVALFRSARLQNGATMPADLTLPAEDASVYGEVSTEGGPVAFGIVHLSLKVNDLSVKYTTDVAPDGTYRFASVPPGSATLSVESWDSQNAQAKRQVAVLLAPGDNRLDIDVTPRD